MPLERMKGQRRKHRPGDVFALRLQEGSYRFGRIVKMGEHTAEARFPGGILVYLYDVSSEIPEPELSELTPGRLLMPPFFTMSWMWHKGYFRTVQEPDLSPHDLLSQHCFYSASDDGYVDENDRRLTGRTEPCGWFSLLNFTNLEREIDEALAGRPVSGSYPKNRG